MSLAPVTRQLSHFHFHPRQILDVKSENIQTALRHAQQVGMMTEPYSYLVTSLDLQSADLEDFKFSRTKISGLRLIDTESSGNFLLKPLDIQTQVHL